MKAQFMQKKVNPKKDQAAKYCLKKRTPQLVKASQELNPTGDFIALTGARQQPQVALPLRRVGEELVWRGGPCISRESMTGGGSTRSMLEAQQEALQEAGLASYELLEEAIKWDSRLCPSEREGPDSTPPGSIYQCRGQAP